MAHALHLEPGCISPLPAGGSPAPLSELTAIRDVPYAALVLEKRCGTEPTCPGRLRWDGFSSFD